MISEKNKQLIAAGLLLLTPPGLKCTKNQIRKASKHIHAAILALSVEARKEELKRRRLAQLRQGELMVRANTQKAITARWAAYADKSNMMTNDEFRRLSAPWEAIELAELLGVSVSRITAYRRKAQVRRVPDEVAKKLLDLVQRSLEEEQARCLPGLEGYIVPPETAVSEKEN